jgi:hypothetical protein
MIIADIDMVDLFGTQYETGKDIKIYVGQCVFKESPKGELDCGQDVFYDTTQDELKVTYAGVDDLIDSGFVFGDKIIFGYFDVDDSGVQFFIKADEVDYKFTEFLDDTQKYEDVQEYVDTNFSVKHTRTY